MSRSYSFGEYRINPALRELWHGEWLIALPPYVFDCLTYLVERHDRAVGRDELVSAVWGKTEISDVFYGLRRGRADVHASSRARRQPDECLCASAVKSRQRRPRRPNW